MSAAHPQTSFRFTYGDYVQWTGDDRWELIDGLPFDMTPAPGSPHQFLLSALHAQVFSHFEGKEPKVLLSAFDVRLPETNESDEKIRTVVQPDLAVVCDPSKIDSRGCRGTPDWIVEILSPGTASKDRTVKLSLYERHGVREFWIIDLDARNVTVYRLQPHGRFDAGSTRPIQGISNVGIFPELAIDWDRALRNI